MKREEAIEIIKTMPIYRMEMMYGGNSDLMKALVMACEALEMQKTEKYNRMIEAFECDFALIEQGEKSFAELDRLRKDERCSLAEHMGLMQELSYLLRHGKAEICLRGKEND